MSQLPPLVDSTGAGPFAPGADRLLADAVSLLRETFDSALELWVRAGTWMRWSADGPSTTGHVEAAAERFGSGVRRVEAEAHRTEPDAAGGLSEILEAAVSRSIPVLEPRGDGRYLLAVPCPAVGGCPLVAVGLVDSTPEETLRRLGALLVGRMSDRRELVERRSELDGCLRQFNEDFEEIHCPLDLSRHLEYCELSRSVRGGFTLVEMSIVVLIVGIFAALAVPKFVGSLCFHRVRAAAERIQADLELARHQARMTGSSQTVEFDVADSSYTIPGLAPLEPGNSDYSVQLQDSLYGVTIVSADFGGLTDVEYDGFGMPTSGGSVVIQCSSYQRTVLVDGETGRASIQ